MGSNRLSIDDLIEIVSNGGRIKTGIDVYNSKGTLLLDKDFFVETAKVLNVIKDNGINSITINAGENSGIWDKNGDPVALDSPANFWTDTSAKEDEDIKPKERLHFDPAAGEIEKKLYEIEEIKKTAEVKYAEAKGNVKKVLNDIKDTGGKFDYSEVENNVADLVSFLTETDNAFSFLTKELFSYDDYLYNHSVNVCAIGTAIISRFNKHFSAVINDFLIKGEQKALASFPHNKGKKDDCFVMFQEDELSDISLGFFLHDIGKVMVAEKILNKKGKLSETEFSEVKKHSYEYGQFILDENKLKNSYLKNIVKYHHAPLFKNEGRCYPDGAQFNKIPAYVKVCKLADIFDAMTSKRSYKEAFNQINVVTDLFRTYADKDRLLQLILHSFVKSIGIYPPGSIVYLKNGQLAYVLHSEGPIVLPFTDKRGKTLQEKPDPIDVTQKDVIEKFQVDANRSVRNPTDVYEILPSYLKKVIS